MNHVDLYLSLKKGEHLGIDCQRLERCGKPSRHRHPSLMEYHMGLREIEQVNPLVLDLCPQFFRSLGSDLLLEGALIDQ